MFWKMKTKKKRGALAIDVMGITPLHWAQRPVSLGQTAVLPDAELRSTGSRSPRKKAFI